MLSIERLAPPARGGRAVLVVGELAGAIAAALYVSGLSRAVGVVVAGVALATVAMGVATVRSSHWPPRRVLYAFGAVLVLLAMLGVVTFIQGFGNRPTTVM
jgi:hypothetical protein